MRLVRMALALGLAALTLGAEGGTGYGQIAFINKTSVTGDLYYNDYFGCTAFGNGNVCVTQVRAGSYVVYAKFTDGTSSGASQLDVVEGQVSNFTVTEG